MGNFKDTLRSIATGKILLKLGADKLFPFILYTFLLGMLSIWLIYRAEITMMKVETNKKIIENLKIEKQNKNCEIISLTRISTLEAMLENAGSEVKAPERPANRIR